MESRAVLFLSQLPIPISNTCYRRFITDIYTSNTRREQCFAGGRSGGSRWDWDENTNAGKRSRFTDAYATDDYDEDEFRFRSDAKQRMWWSDDFYPEDDEEDQGFGIFEAAIGFNWVFKVFRAFGWMIPAVMISLLLGTGPNAIVMALALPLAQSAFSLAAETLFGGRSDETPRPKSKSKKRPFSRAKGRTRARKEKDIRTQAEKEAQNYKSWVDANNVPGKKDKTYTQDFGGWDELDNQVRAKKEPANEPRLQERVKMSRRTKGETPLLTRLLIAMFPFLGFWTKLF